MFNREVEAVLSVIALSIFADKRVLSTEITAFVKSADIIKAHVRSNLPLSEAKLLLWLEMNREQIKAKMQLGPAEFEAWFDSIFEAFAKLPDKTFISEIVETIAQADGELHVSEKALSVMLERKFKKSA